MENICATSPNITVFISKLVSPSCPTHHYSLKKQGRADGEMGRYGLVGNLPDIKRKQEAMYPLIFLPCGFQKEEVKWREGEQSMPLSLSPIPSSNLMCALRRGRQNVDISRQEKENMGTREALSWTWPGGVYMLSKDSLQAPQHNIHHDPGGTAVLPQAIENMQRCQW